MKKLVKQVLRLLLYPVLRYFGPRFHNLQARLDELPGRLDQLGSSLNSRLDQFENRMASDVETAIELMATGQRSARPAVGSVMAAPAAPAEKADARISDSLARLQERLESGSGMSHCKVCELGDFADPALMPVLREVFAHELERFGPEFPVGFEYRKHWEVAMAVRSLTDLGVVHDRAEILGVGAGNEPTIFYLTNLVKRVFATDIYLDPGVWKEFADSSMLLDPGRHWPFAWNPRRLVVQHMDALDLAYEDNTFDGIFSSSSVEHFGEVKDVERSMDEMFRVLRPGGVLSLSTEYRLEGDTMGVPGCLMFSREEMLEHLVGDRDWSLVSPFSTQVSTQTREAEGLQDELMADFEGHLDEEGSVGYHELEFTRWPQVMMRKGPLVWTSAHLALRKGSGGSPDSSLS